MKINPLTKENIASVFASLSDTSTEDAKALGITVTAMGKRFAEAIGEPFTGAFYSGEKCCALLRLEVRGNMLWRAYFVDAKDGLKDISVSFTRFMKRMSDHMVKEKGVSVEILSRRQGIAADWFEVMGFRYDGRSGKFHRYIKK